MEDIKEKSEKFVELLSDFYKKFFESVSGAVDSLADIERDYPEDYIKIKEFADNPDSIGELTEELSLEKQAILLKILLKSGKFAKDFINLLNLDEAQKRKLSKDLTDFAKEISP